jgi:hypothetical protein
MIGGDPLRLDCSSVHLDHSLSAKKNCATSIHCGIILFPVPPVDRLHRSQK